MTERSMKNELIDKFLREELSEEELLIFRKRWDSDPDFVKEVQDYATMTTALKAAHRLDENNEKARTRFIDPFKKAFFKYQSVAAIFLLAIMLPLYLLLQGQKRAITAESPEIKVLAKSHFIKRTWDENFVKDIKGNMLGSVVAYQDGDIRTSIDLVKLAEKEEGQQYALILAPLYFELNQPDSALYYYHLGLQSSPNDSVARWNSLMSKLLLGQLAQVKEELRFWPKSKNTLYSKKASDLLMSLE